MREIAKLYTNENQDRQPNHNPFWELGIHVGTDILEGKISVDLDGFVN